MPSEGTRPGKAFVTDASYPIVDEITLGVGYVNRASLVAPDGMRRGIGTGHNVWRSPSAAVFLDVTPNLDKAYKWMTGARVAATGGPAPSKSAAMP